LNEGQVFLTFQIRRPYGGLNRAKKMPPGQEVRTARTHFGGETGGARLPG
jgi:hypothetical protein